MLLLWCSPNRTNMYSVLLVIRFPVSILRKEKPPPYLWTTFADLFIAHSMSRDRKSRVVSFGCFSNGIICEQTLYLTAKPSGF
jgi:hypothetical protein